MNYNPRECVVRVYLCEFTEYFSPFICQSISANLTTSTSTNVILSTIFHNRTRPISTNSGHYKDDCTKSHLENEVTVSSKTTPSKPIRKSLRQNMVRNINVYNKQVKKHMKEYNYMKALRALHDRRNTILAHKDKN